MTSNKNEDSAAAPRESPKGILQYDYENGGWLRVMWRDVSTPEALDMIETLVRMKREEYEAKFPRSDTLATRMNG